jgi:hypothetical protein
MTGSRSTAALLRTAMGRPQGCPDLPGDHDWVVSTEQRILRTQEPTMAKTYRAVQVSKAADEVAEAPDPRVAEPWWTPFRACARTVAW